MSNKVVLGIAIILVLLAACGPAAPALVPIPTAPSPTLTPIPRTATPPPTGTPVPPTAGLREPVPAGALRITVLYDNSAYDSRLQADWGFAALIEYRGHTLLFDTGSNPTYLLNNVDLLGIDLTGVEAVVLSHDHLDHTGGLPGLADRGFHPPVYVLPSFPSSFRTRFRGQFELRDVAPGQELSDGIFTTGEMVDPGIGIYEQSLVISTSQGLVVVTGCAHPGIVAIVTRAKEMGPVHLVLGGFHLGEMNRSDIRAIVDDFRRLGVERAGPTHCTGETAIAVFAEAYGEDFVQAGAGRVLVIAGR